jgi:hypothetical protein
VARHCNGCTACCHVVAVKEIELPPFTSCPHVRGVLHAGGPGCGIYHERPYSCRSWRCMWLKNEDWPEELRPDRLGVVVDEFQDLVSIGGRKLRAAQLWVLPGFETKVLESPGVTAIIRSLLRVRSVKLEGGVTGHIGAVLMRLPSKIEAWAFHRNAKGQIERTYSRLDEGTLELGDEEERHRQLMRMGGER